tara:strand:- start:397 stop:831 length:435 start_codon:yes stop_codon:yes gene_type:complete
MHNKNMKKTTVEKLNKVLDVTGDLIPVGNNKKAPDVEMTETDLTSDYDFSRDQYHTLVNKGNDALDELLAVAKESESARAYEVAAMLIRNLSDTTKELLQLQKTKKEIEKDVKDPHTVNNSLFIGSTKELQDLLLENKKNGKRQ